jgi:aspartyl-tRNA(Asn)/glutamyl-tRNA(Gln) amidotransferase subunit A
MTDLADLSAVDLLKQYRSKSLSPLEVTKAVVERIEAYEPKLQAMWSFDPEGALSSARGAEQRWQKGEPTGALDGVPITIKENIATKGVAVPLGTAATELKPSPVDAPPAARSREAGAVILGKTTMPDYGMLSSGLSSFHKLARNPWDLTKNPGGSSAGAGAAAAAGYGPLHIGTDIGGSVRLPASWCGIFTLKPSLGRIPIDPPYMGRVAGPMTRSVTDSALMMNVLSHPDTCDHMSLPYEAFDWLNLDRDVKGLRFGLMLEAGCGLPVDPEVTEAVKAAAKALEQAGAIIEPMKPFLTRTMLDGVDHFWRMRARIDLMALPPARRAKVLPYIAGWAMSSEGQTGEQVFQNFGQFMAMRAAANNASLAYDYVLSPTAPNVAYAAELPSPTNDFLKPLEHIGFTVAFNMSEQPAASINCGYTKSGLPIGLQIVGQRFDDLGVLRVCRAFEKIRGAQKPWPKP